MTGESDRSAALVRFDGMPGGASSAAHFAGAADELEDTGVSFA